MPGKNGAGAQRLTARRKFQVYVETRGKDAPVGEILRRWNLSLEQLREIEHVVEHGALQALKVRSGHRPRATDVTPESFEQVSRELQEKERALVEISVELALVKKGLRSDSGTDNRRTTSPSRSGP
jgi:hypothetical protein